MFLDTPRSCTLRRRHLFPQDAPLRDAGLYRHLAPGQRPLPPASTGTPPTNQALLDALRAEIAAPAAADAAVLNDAPLRAARDALIHSFDPVHGGFGGAPKFPHPTSLEHLLRCWAASVQGGEPDRPAETAVLSTLRKMALGGIYDHLGGGFYRYSVDAEWQIPHFEKMLYDNGPLLALYAQAWQATQDPLFRTAAEETGAWLLREMQDPAGGYYATPDADSEGEEGKFYLWTPDQVRELLSTEEYVAFAVCQRLEQPPTLENHTWHLRRIAEPSELASRLAVAPEQVDEWLAAARRKLLEARSQRIWPGRDEKILTAWNGLTIRGMAIAGRHPGRPSSWPRRSVPWISSAPDYGGTVDCWRSTRMVRRA